MKYGTLNSIANKINTLRQALSKLAANNFTNDDLLPDEETELADIAYELEVQVNRLTKA